MLSAELYAAELTMHMRVEERRHQATIHDMLRRTGSLGAGLLRQMRSQLGSYLVALGRRLQQAGSSHVRHLEGRMSEGH